MFRFRNLFLVLGSAAIVAALYFTDPDQGRSTAVMLMGVAAGVVGVAFAHLARKALSDYPEADMRTLFKTARQSSTGAGLALIAQAIVLAALLGLFGSHARAAPLDAAVDIPPAAWAHLPTLRAEALRLFPDHPAPEMLAGLAEQESCPSLTHRFCWSPSARLLTSREEGAGIPQLTRAWTPAGALRFDTLAALRERHAELADLHWHNVYRRVDLQLRALVLMQRDLYVQMRRVVPDVNGALPFVDAAYNGGFGGVQADRRACGMRAGCDPQRWFGHTELSCTKSRQVLYGQRSACDINREHVRHVVLVRSAKYGPAMRAGQGGVL